MNDKSCQPKANCTAGYGAVDYNSSDYSQDTICTACSSDDPYTWNANNDRSACGLHVGCSNTSTFLWKDNTNATNEICAECTPGAEAKGPFSTDCSCKDTHIANGTFCVAKVFGCTDATAFNYDSTANTDDGTCQAVVNGCTDATAFNYDSTANTDDGSCTYTCTCGNGVGATTCTATDQSECASCNPDYWLNMNDQSC